MAGLRIDINSAALKALDKDPGVLRAVQEFTDREIVPEMRARAPKDSGEGARSIRSEADPDGDGFRVSFDKDHFYLAFHELGTVHQHARPFMRPTADRFNRA